MINWEQYRYFSREEFDSPDLEGSGNSMQELFILPLHKARISAGIPFKINSGYRTEEHNKSVGGVENSPHTGGWAADIHCVDSVSRHKIISSLIEVGFNRIGIAKTFIHVDNQPSKPPYVIWTY